MYSRVSPAPSRPSCRTWRFKLDGENLHMNCYSSISNNSSFADPIGSLHSPMRSLGFALCELKEPVEGAGCK
ncbi:hypothetical protein EYF80_023984 [Liparis tanakae]|uniref:Uncharacterized protein n=1 Tax=Liparis tanakae TaxID=230148 RepID=A0A4Z2HM15_9TELE|nr:hypothetical protein EYF80_023984 [Liparis tanakae]